MTSQNNVIAHCPHCGNTAPQIELGWSRCMKDGGVYDYNHRQCSTCKESLLYRSSENLIPLDDVINGKTKMRGDGDPILIWPAPDTLHSSIPDCTLGEL